jgi:hypothetical protein
MIRALKEDNRGRFVFDSDEEDPGYRLSMLVRGSIVLVLILTVILYGVEILKEGNLWGLAAIFVGLFFGFLIIKNLKPFLIRDKKKTECKQDETH